MHSLLQNLQDDISKYAEAIKGITGTDVEIVDENMIRVAGTGVYRYMLNVNVADEGHIYHHSMKSKKTVLVENPRENILCFSCTKQSFCTEKLDLTTPIFLNDHVIGVISIICLTDEQKNNIMSQFEKFINFIEQISELVSGKVFEYIERLRAQDMIGVYRAVFEYIDKGVIAVNHLQHVWHANLSANRLFGIEEDIIGKTLTIDFIKQTPFGEEEGYLTLDGLTIRTFYNCESLSPLDGERLTMIIFQKVDHLTPEIETTQAKSVETLVGNSAKMIELKKTITKIAASHTNVLITGETGTGKEIVATTLYQQSLRKQGPFVTINCAAIPDQLLESELFGYVKGAFSGADPKGRIGKFELANQGTIFLDEIGDMPINLQAKLLRVLQEGKLSRIGSNTEISIDVRVIAATNKNLLKLIEEGTFREDLYYRLNVVPLLLVPLRERKSDITELVNHFSKKYSTLHQQGVMTIPNDIINQLYQYDWPGNIRELRNVIEYMYVMKGDSHIFNKTHLPPQLFNIPPKINQFAIAKKPSSNSLSEKEVIKKVIDKYGWDLLGKKQAAQELTISLATLYRKLKKYELS